VPQSSPTYIRNWLSTERFCFTIFSLLRTRPPQPRSPLYRRSKRRGLPTGLSATGHPARRGSVLGGKPSPAGVRTWRSRRAAELSTALAHSVATSKGTGLSVRIPATTAQISPPAEMARGPKHGDLRTVGDFTARGGGSLARRRSAIELRSHAVARQSRDAAAASVLKPASVLLLATGSATRAQYRFRSALPLFSDARGNPRINRGSPPRGNGAGGLGSAFSHLGRQFAPGQKRSRRSSWSAGNLPPTGLWGAR
jgi:hypothetical protein